MRIASGVTATASLNESRKVNAVSPSCASGTPSNAAVSGSATLPDDEPRAAAVTVIVAGPRSGWDVVQVFIVRIVRDTGDAASPRR